MSHQHNSAVKLSALADRDDPVGSTCFCMVFTQVSDFMPAGVARQYGLKSALWIDQCRSKLIERH